MKKSIIHLLWGAALIIALGFSFSTCSDDNDTAPSNGPKRLPATIYSADDTFNSQYVFEYDDNNRIVSIQKSVGFNNAVNQIQHQQAFTYNDKGQLERVKIIDGVVDQDSYAITQDFEYVGNTINVVEKYEREGADILTFKYALAINKKQQLTKMSSDDLMQYYEFSYDSKGNLQEATEFENEGRTVAFKDVYAYDESVIGVFVDVEMPAWYYQFDRGNEFVQFSSPNAIVKRSTYISDETGLQEAGITDYDIEKTEARMLSQMTPRGAMASKQAYRIEYLERK